MSDIDAIQEQVVISLNSLRDLEHYSLFIVGALLGAPLAIGAVTLGSTFYGVGQEFDMTEISSMLLQFVAMKG
jgi:hypothetical protein